jgi:iron complex transport system substrate-binding protein
MFTGFTSLDEVDRAILVIGYLTGQDDAAHRIHNQFLAAIERAKARKPQDAKAPRILGYAGRYGYGDQTFFNDVIRAVGGVNVAAEHGVHGYDPISSEDVLRWNPDWIVAGTPNGNAAQELQRLLQDPVIALTTAAQNGQVLVLDNKVFLPMSPFSTQLLDALGEALYAKH